MILIPEHVTKYFDFVEKSLSQTKCDMSPTFLNKIRRLRRELETQTGPHFKRGSKLVGTLLLMKEAFAYVQNAFEQCNIKIPEKFVKEIVVDTDLIQELNYARERRPKLREDVEDISLLIRNAAESSWGQYDSKDDFKVFKLVKDHSELRKIRDKYGIMDLSNNSFNEPLLTHIRLCYESKYDEEYEGTLKKLADYVRTCYCEPNGVSFSYLREEFEFWFHVGITGTYYVYIPKRL